MRRRRALWLVNRLQLIKERADVHKTREVLSRIDAAISDITEQLKTCDGPRDLSVSGWLTVQSIVGKNRQAHRHKEQETAALRQRSALLQQRVHWQGEYDACRDRLANQLRMKSRLERRRYRQGSDAGESSEAFSVDGSDASIR